MAAEHQSAHEASEGVEPVFVQLLLALTTAQTNGLLPRPAPALVPAAAPGVGGASEGDAEAQA